MSADVAARRLASQQIAGSRFTDPAALLAHMGALQAQDLGCALWGIGLRVPGSTLAQLHGAIADKQLVRTWLQRGTLHIAAGADLRWMLALLAPRNVAGAAGRHRQLELDDKVFTKAAKILAKALAGTTQTRAALFALLEEKGIATGGQRGIHILWRLAQDGLLCFSDHHARQPSFALLDDWLPAAPAVPRDEALARLAQRYFTSHGPASAADFAWWAGLTLAEARRAMADAGPVECEVLAQPGVHLLPGFDAYLLGYKERSAVLDPAHANLIVPGGNGVFKPMLVVDGQISGTWHYRDGEVHAEPFGAAPRQTALRAAAARYKTFMESA